MEFFVMLSFLHCVSKNDFAEVNTFCVIPYQCNKNPPPTLLHMPYFSLMCISQFCYREYIFERKKSLIPSAVSQIVTLQTSTQAHDEYILRRTPKGLYKLCSWRMFPKEVETFLNQQPKNYLCTKLQLPPSHHVVCCCFVEA